MAQLSLQEQYAAAELFRGTMVRHSVVVYPNDSPGGAQQVSFAGDAWLGYVPIRTSDTIVVQERLPPGAAAVLINRSHTYTDLYLPIDAQQRKLFDAIDGKRAVADIISLTATQQDARDRLERACTFFERLWWYDQVVFDASHHHQRGRMGEDDRNDTHQKRGR